MAELSTVARPYAEALFEHARDEGTLTQWSELLTIMAQVVAQHDVQEALNNPTLSHDQRYELFIGLLDTKLRSEEHTSELQSRGHLVCRLLLEKKKYLFISH